MSDNDEAIVLYSGLWAFGHLLKIRRSNINKVLHVIREAVGAHRTLILPAFTFEFSSSKLYDIALSRPETGVIPETAAKSEYFARTVHPMVSHLVSGPLVGSVLSCQQTTAWGPDSVMGLIEERNLRVAVLGVTWGEGCAFLHRSEESFGVPYRYFKRFAGESLRNRKPIGPCQEIMFVRPMGVPFERNYSVIDSKVSSLKSFRSGGDEQIFAQSVLAQDLNELCTTLLNSNPYVFARNELQLRDWVATGKDKEISELLIEQRPTGKSFQ